jgi:hypothetical protein
MSNQYLWNLQQYLIMEMIAEKMHIDVIEAIELFSAEYREKIPFYPPNSTTGR